MSSQSKHLTLNKLAQIYGPGTICEIRDPHSIDRLVRIASTVQVTSFVKLCTFAPSPLSLKSAGNLYYEFECFVFLEIFL